MARRRLMGLECEFGCLLHDPSLDRPEDVVEALKDHCFREKRLGLLDLHARDYAFEPPECGGFLANGGRLYVDAVGDHLEYATPEVTGVRDLVAYDHAGRRIILGLIDDVFSRDAVSIHNNSVDHFGGHTFGCHENYSVSLDDDQIRPAMAFLISFLVTRQIFAGAGRVGGHRLTHDTHRQSATDDEYDLDTIWVGRVYGVEPDDTVRYQLSQRADHILHPISGRVRFSRAIINPRSEAFHDLVGQWRMHILFGEANMSEYATALKVGTTNLVLGLAEMGCVSIDPWLARPVPTLRRLSRDESMEWLVTTVEGKTISAIDHQRIFLELAERELAGSDDDADWTLREWRRTLDDLEEDPTRLADRLDWPAKRSMLELFMEEEGLDWHDESLHSLDLEYHNIDPERGLYSSLVEMGGVETLVDDAAIERAVAHPPDDTRAKARGRAVRAILDGGFRNYVLDWDSVYVVGRPDSARLILDTPEGPPDDVVDGFCADIARLGADSPPELGGLWVLNLDE